jgi:hypothetical protein
MATLVIAMAAISPAVRGPGAVRAHQNRLVRRAQAAPAAAASRWRPDANAATAPAASAVIVG